METSNFDRILFWTGQTPYDSTEENNGDLNSAMLVDEDPATDAIFLEQIPNDEIDLLNAAFPDKSSKDILMEDADAIPFAHLGKLDENLNVIAKKDLGFYEEERVKEKLIGNAEILFRKEEIQNVVYIKVGNGVQKFFLTCLIEEQQLTFEQIEQVFHENPALHHQLSQTKSPLKFETKNGACTLKFDRSYSLEELKNLFTANNFQELNRYLKRRRDTDFSKKRDLFFNSFSSEELTQCFHLNYPKFKHLALDLLPFASCDDLGIAKNLFQKGVEYGCSSYVRRAIDAHPEMIDSLKESDENIKNCFLSLISAGFFSLARELMEKNKHIEFVNIQRNLIRDGCYYAVETPLGNVLRFIIDEAQNYKWFKLSFQNEINRFVEFLIANGADVNQRISADNRTEFECPVVEKCFFSTLTPLEISEGEIAYTKLFYGKTNPKLPIALSFVYIANILLNKGARITPRMLNHIMVVIKATGESGYENYLKAENGLDQAEIEKANELKQIYQTYLQASSPLTGVAKKVVDARFFLQNSFTRFNLSMHLLSLQEVSQARNLKKELKKRVHEFEDPLLLKEYHTMCEQYDALVDKHPLLFELRKVSKEFRLLSHQKKHSPSKRLLRVWGLFGLDPTYSTADAREKIKSIFVNKNISKIHFEAIRHKILDIAEKVQNEPYLWNHFIVWFHGTKSSSIPLIRLAGGLDSLHQLLEKNLVPFSGELCGSEKTINKTQLSGERFCLNWKEGNGLYHDSLTRAVVAKKYAEQEIGYHKNKKVFDPETAWKHASPEQLETLIAEKSSRSVDWLHLRVDILRLRSSDKEADVKLADFKKALLQKIQNCTSQNKSQNKQENLEIILKALECELNFPFSANDLEVMTHPHPFGVIFASTNAYSSPLSNKNPAEYLAKGPLELKKKIQVAFAALEKISELKGLLPPSIKVYDFDTLFFLEMMNMIKGSRLRKVKKALKLEKDHPELIQRFISIAMQFDILPGYATPFPPRPKFKDPGNFLGKQLISNPYWGPGIHSHEEYLKKIQEGVILPRSCHGPMHAARTSIWSQGDVKLYRKAKKEINIDQEKLAITAGSHDRLRGDEAKDYWDRASSQWIKGYMLALGYEKKEIKPSEHAVEHKDPQDSLFTSDIQKMTHDGDVLEFLRILGGLEGFRKEELCFYRDLKTDLGVEYLDRYIEEVNQFIQMTEDLRVKMHLEYKVSNFYGTLFRLMGCIHENTNQFPLINELFEQEIKVFANLELDKELLALLV